MSDLRLFLPIGKVDEAKRLVYGVLTAEVADKNGEVFDYASGKEAFEKFPTRAPTWRGPHYRFFTHRLSGQNKV